jgi:hypothetical protein
MGTSPTTGEFNSSLSGFLFVPHVVELWKLLVKQQDVEPYSYYPVFRERWARYSFNAIRATAIFALVPLYFFNTYEGYYHTNLSKEPRAPGLSSTAGYYNVTEFRLNGKDIPYSPLDPVRREDAVFEDYPTFTYKVNHAWKIRLDNQSPMHENAQKRYELAGFAGAGGTSAILSTRASSFSMSRTRAESLGSPVIHRRHRLLHEPLGQRQGQR